MSSHLEADLRNDRPNGLLTQLSYLVGLALLDPLGHFAQQVRPLLLG